MALTKGILVDTSIWIAYFRGSNEKLRQRLNEYLDKRCIFLSKVVRAELMSGVKESEIFKLERVLSPLPTIIPEKRTWDMVEDLVKIATKNGLRFGIVDLLIAASAREHNLMIWSLDNDFRSMEKLGIIEILY